MKETAINIKAQNKPGVLRDITDMLAGYGINITYTHLFLEGKESASIYMELEYVENVEKFINIIRNFEEVSKIEIHRSLGEIYGKRIIIIGGGAQVAMVAQGAITEADRHNIRGERISVDTIPLVGENELAEAVSAVGRLPRVGALVLAGSLMGGKISAAIEEIKIDHEVIVISLNMPGGVTEKADLVVTDPVQAGVMAVMAVADTAIFDIKKIRTLRYINELGNFENYLNNKYTENERSYSTFDKDYNTFLYKWRGKMFSYIYKNGYSGDVITAPRKLYDLKRKIQIEKRGYINARINAHRRTQDMENIINAHK